jgi:hypothetical protein
MRWPTRWRGSAEHSNSRFEEGVAMPESHSTTAAVPNQSARPRKPDAASAPATPSAGKPAKPAKPYPDYPLYAHGAGVWAKRIRGKLHYFGPWSDPDGALKKYLAQKEALHAGRKPREQPGGATAKDAANAFLNAKKELVERDASVMNSP